MLLEIFYEKQKKKNNAGAQKGFRQKIQPTTLKVTRERTISSK